MATATVNAAVNNNQAAAAQAQDILSGSKWESVKKFIKNAPGLITKSLQDASVKIDDIGAMNEEQTAETVHRTFSALRANVQGLADDLRAAAVEASDVADKCKGLEESVETLFILEKDILASEKNILKKVSKLVLSTLIFIGKKLLQGAKKAALVIASVGIRILCIGAGFVIKFVRTAVKTGKTMFRMVKVYKTVKAEQAKKNQPDEGEVLFEEE